MAENKSRPLMSVGTFALASAFLAVAWVAREHFGSWWPFAVAVPLAAIVNIVGMVSPDGSVFWVFKESLRERRNKRPRD